MFIGCFSAGSALRMGLLTMPKFGSFLYLFSRIIVLNYSFHHIIQSSSAAPKQFYRV